MLEEITRDCESYRNDCEAIDDPGDKFENKIGKNGIGVKEETCRDMVEAFGEFARNKDTQSDDDYVFCIFSFLVTQIELHVSISLFIC